MARRKKRRMRRAFKFLWRHRLLLITVLFLAGAGKLFWSSIKWYEAHMAHISELEKQLVEAEKSPDMIHAISLQRQLDLERLEPFLNGLLLAIPLTFGTVLIAVIMNTRSGTHDSEASARRWNEMMEERRAERAASRPPRRSDDD